jgi:DNA-binding beta-propeller fold protein YncE
MAALLVLASSAAMAREPQRTLYAVNQAKGDRGSISVYDIDDGHRLIRTIRTVADVRDVRGVAASAVTGKLYVSYRDIAKTGRIFCLDMETGRVVWDRVIPPGVDRLAISPDGRLLYVPTWEGGTADFINIVDAKTGDIVRRVHFSNHSHDTQYPLSGPVFQETKAEDGSGRFLYLINPHSYDVSRIGPFAGILGPYAVDGASTHVVNCVTHLWGMQVADLKTGKIITAAIPDHPPGDPGLLHGIGWTPDESEVWQAGGDSHVYVWDMHDPMAPVLKDTLALQGSAPHWVTFTIRGDYAYISPTKDTGDKTEVFDTKTHKLAGAIGSSEDMLEVDFADGKVSRVGDQFGIGRKQAVLARAGDGR